MAPRDFLNVTERISVLPVIHGSGDFAVEVRDRILRLEPDCGCGSIYRRLFRMKLKQVWMGLPYVSMVSVNEEAPSYLGDNEALFGETWEQEQQPEDDSYAEDGSSAGETNLSSYSYVPIDPCQPVISALRVAMGERIPRVFIDLEVERFSAGCSCAAGSVCTEKSADGGFSPHLF